MRPGKSCGEGNAHVHDWEHRLEASEQGDDEARRYRCRRCGIWGWILTRHYIEGERDVRIYAGPVLAPKPAWTEKRQTKLWPGGTRRKPSLDDYDR